VALLTIIKVTGKLTDHLTLFICVLLLLCSIRDLLGWLLLFLMQCSIVYYHSYYSDSICPWYCIDNYCGSVLYWYWRGVGQLLLLYYVILSILCVCSLLQEKLWYCCVLVLIRHLVGSCWLGHCPMCIIVCYSEWHCIDDLTMILCELLCQWQEIIVWRKILLY